MPDLYRLPDLPFAYDALEPWCDAETMHLHHDKHHRAYVSGANAAVERLAELEASDAAARAGVQAALVFNVSGHVLHSLFWETLTPGGERPNDELRQLVERDFGSFDRMRALLVATCVGVQGSGWGVLLQDPIAGHLHVVGIHDHHRDLIPSAAVLALVDVWEHAYYLRYRNERARWCEAAVEHLNWDVAASRVSRATSAASR